MNTQSSLVRPCLRPVMRFKRDMARRKNYGWNWPLIAAVFFTIVFWSLFFCAIKDCHAQVMQPAIDMDKIAMIESSGNPRAWRKADDSIGLYQITPIVLKEWNNFHPAKHFSRADLWDPEINFVIADWYMSKRIPEMLKHFKIEDTVENRIFSYNAGIGNVIKNRMPKTTRIYLAKYRKGNYGR